MDCQRHHTESEQREADFHTRGEAAPVRRGCRCKVLRLKRRHHQLFQAAVAKQPEVRSCARPRRQMGVLEWVGANDIAARVGLRHVGVGDAADAIRTKVAR